MQNVYRSQCIAYIIDCIHGIIMNILHYILSNSLRKLLSDLEQCWKREVYYALFAFDNFCSNVFCKLFGKLSLHQPT